MNGYQETSQEICQRLQTDAKKGLSRKEAEKRIEEYGFNELEESKPPSIISIFLSQFKDPLIYILLVAAGIIFFIGQTLDAFIISGILLFNSIIGTVQEKKTADILNGLKKFLKSESIVIRDSNQEIIENKYLVPGDIIYIKTGEKVPADARILECHNITVDEAILTGESRAIGKVSHACKKDNLSIHDQNNMLFQGTYILSGQAIAIITKTGSNTQAGRLHKEIKNINTNIPLKKELERFSYAILIFVLVMCAALFTIGFLTGKTLTDLLVMLTALFICVVPEGLPVVMTLVLVTGAHRMAKRNVLVKHLQAIEALGRVDIIVTDKTGTLTRNEMVISKVVVDETILDVSGTGYFLEGKIENHQAHKNLLDEIATVCSILNDTKIEFDAHLNLFKVKGDPTQAAAYVFAQKVSPDFAAIKEQFTTHYTIPFDSTARYKAAFCSKIETPDQYDAFVMGAPETILTRCKNTSDYVTQQLKTFLKQGFRVVAVAHKTYTPPAQKTLGEYRKVLEQDLEFLGLLMIHDAVRENLAPIIKEAKQAKIKMLMATGDHKTTAQHIAEDVNIAEPGDLILTGEEFEQLDDQTAVQMLKKTSVCARFSPQNKLRLIKLFHSQNKIVAMTGDGINDVPALTASDISIAMGNIGTELTKQASDIVLLQDSFENILYAIKQGRNIFYALRRTILYFLTSNMGEVLIMFFALALNLPLPLLAAQILWLNLVTDGFLDMALAMEPQLDDQLSRADQDIPQKIFDASMLYKMLYLSLPMSLAGLFTFIYHYKTDIVLARTLTLLVLTMFQWFNAWNCRSENKSIFQLGLFSNGWLILATLAVLFLQVGVIYLPFMQQIFRTVPLTKDHWIFAIGISSSILIIEEIRKLIYRTFFSSTN